MSGTKYRTSARHLNLRHLVPKLQVGVTGGISVPLIAPKEKVISSTGDKVKGKANELTGKGKQGAGEATNNPNLKGEGKGQEVRGKAQQIKGKAKDKI